MGNTYAGQWRNGKMHGTAVRTFEDGSRYDGEYKDGQPDGHGTLTWPGGQRYEGQWRLGKKHGRGIATSANGRQRRGEWADGQHLKWIESPDAVKPKESGATRRLACRSFRQCALTWAAALSKQSATTR